MFINIMRLSRLLVILFVSARPVLADDWDRCRRVSFAPLDMDIPACTQLINEGRLTDDKMVTALLARAEAYLFARTYRFGHNVSPAQLMTMALADLDRSISMIRNNGALSDRLISGLKARASLLYELGGLNPQRGTIQKRSKAPVPVSFQSCMAMLLL